MKRIILHLLLLLLPLGSGAFTGVVDIDGVKYNVSTDAGTAEAIGLSNPDFVGALTIPGSVAYDGITCRVVSVEGFSSNKGITSLTLSFEQSETPVTVKSHAFSDCASLETLYLENVELGYESFASCYNLRNATFVNVECGKHEESRCFKYCDNLENLTIDCNYVKSWFPAPNKIKKVEFGKNVEVIGARAFWHSALTSVVIPSNVTGIYTEAFYSCIKLESVTFSMGLQQIGPRAFGSCEMLKSIDIPGTVKILGATPTDGWTEGESFSGCEKLESVTLPIGMTAIGQGTFRGCSSLKDIVMPEGLTEITQYMFLYCYSLESVSIPSTVQKIGHCAFGSNSSLKRVTCNAQNPPAVAPTIQNPGIVSPPPSSDPFYDCNLQNVRLLVPEQSIESYKKAEVWKEFGSVDGYSEKCDAPSVAYSNGKLTLYSNTEGANFVTTIEDTDVGTHKGAVVPLSTTYHIRIYAEKEGLLNSDPVTATLRWTDAAPKMEGLENGGTVHIPVHQQFEHGKANMPTRAFSGRTTVDGLWYNIDTEAGTAEVTWSDADSKYSGDIAIPSAIEYNGVNCSVTAIGDNAFNICDDLTSVTIPSSVTSIGEYNQEIKGVTNVEIIPVSA